MPWVGSRYLPVAWLHRFFRPTLSHCLGRRMELGHGACARGYLCLVRRGWPACLNASSFRSSACDRRIWWRHAPDEQERCCPIGRAGTFCHGERHLWGAAAQLRGAAVLQAKYCLARSAAAVAGIDLSVRAQELLLGRSKTVAGKWGSGKTKPQVRFPPPSMT